MNKAIFLDKDGTLIEDVPYNIKPELIRFTHGSIQALRNFQHAGYLLVLVSNQAGVAHGYFTEKELMQLKDDLDEMLLAEHIRLDATFFCPHHPHGKVATYTKECTCRKPEPGMFLRAAKILNIDLSKSWMIGDILNDVEAGHRAGCKTILIDNGNETEWKISPARTPTLVVCDMAEAAEKILFQYATT